MLVLQHNCIYDVDCYYYNLSQVPAGTQVQIPLYVTNVNDETPSLENQPYSVYVPEVDIYS